jgi:hypothetical protein
MQHVYSAKYCNIALSLSCQQLQIGNSVGLSAEMRK